MKVRRKQETAWAVCYPSANKKSTGIDRQPRSHVQVVNGCNIRKWYADCESVLKTLPAGAVLHANGALCDDALLVAWLLGGWRRVH